MIWKSTANALDKEKYFVPLTRKVSFNQAAYWKHQHKRIHYLLCWVRISLMQWSLFKQGFSSKRSSFEICKKLHFCSFVKTICANFLVMSSDSFHIFHLLYFSTLIKLVSSYHWQYYEHCQGIMGLTVQPVITIVLVLEFLVT